MGDNIIKCILEISLKSWLPGKNSLRTKQRLLALLGLKKGLIFSGIMQAADIFPPASCARKSLDG